MTRTDVVKNTITFSDDFWKDLFDVRDTIEGLEDVSDIEDLEYEAFNYDHAEWYGQWMNDKNALPILKKHKVSGELILSYEGRLGGWVFVDGESKDFEIEITTTVK